MNSKATCLVPIILQEETRSMHVGPPTSVPGDFGQGIQAQIPEATACSFRGYSPPTLIASSKVKSLQWKLLDTREPA